MSRKRVYNHSKDSFTRYLNIKSTPSSSVLSSTHLHSILNAFGHYTQQSSLLPPGSAINLRTNSSSRLSLKSQQQHILRPSKMCLKIYVNYSCRCQREYVLTKCEDVLAAEKEAANGVDMRGDSIRRLGELCRINTVRSFSGRNFKCSRCFTAMCA
jgi:hypothetical protein